MKMTMIISRWDLLDIINTLYAIKINILLLFHMVWIYDKEITKACDFFH